MALPALCGAGRLPWFLPCCCAALTPWGGALLLAMPAAGGLWPCPHLDQPHLHTVTPAARSRLLQPGDYGRARTWASLTWTLFSPVAGLVNAHFGIPVGIACYAVGSLCAVPTALALPVHALRQKVRGGAKFAGGRQWKKGQGGWSLSANWALQAG